jgi:hypothetical protein
VQIIGWLVWHNKVARALYLNENTVLDLKLEPQARMMTKSLIAWYSNLLIFHLLNSHRAASCGAAMSIS